MVPFYTAQSLVPQWIKQNKSSRNISVVQNKITMETYTLECQKFHSYVTEKKICQNGQWINFTQWNVKHY